MEGSLSSLGWFTGLITSDTALTGCVPSNTVLQFGYHVSPHHDLPNTSSQAV